HLAHPALQGQAPIGVETVGGLSGSLCAKVEQSAAIVAKLREQEAAAVADLRIVHAELMAVITQRQRLRQVVGQRAEPAEMRGPALFTELKPDPQRSAAVEKARRASREFRDLDRVVEITTELEDFRIGAILGHPR